MYIDGVKGMTFYGTANGKQQNTQVEKLLIGGFKAFDPTHNAETLISDVRVYDRALHDKEISILFEMGRRSQEK